MILEFVLVLAIILLYSHFSGKIKNLEREIDQLKKSKNLETATLEKPEIRFQTEEVSKEIPQIPTPVSASFTKEFEPEKTGQQPTWMDSLSAFVKQNLLTIIGIFTLVLGIGYFVKYAIDQNWIGETARFSIGIFTGLGILIMGFFLKKNYKIFSSILSGGGLAILYLSVTLAFREYQLFSQNTAFILLIVITILSVVIAWFYDSETIVIFALIGGFGSPLMVSTGVSNYPFLFTYVTFLNLGMVAIAFLKNWKNIGWVAFFLTYLYLISWIFDKTESLTVWFAVIFYVIFYAFALRNYFKKGNTNASDILMLVLTNVITLSVIVYIYKNLKMEPVILFPVIFAVINAAFLFYESTKKRINLYHPVFVGITLSLITVAVAIQFKTHFITSLWAIESVLLIYLWKKTRQNIFKISFGVLIPLVILAEIFTWTRYDDGLNVLKPFLNPVFLTGILVSICFGISYFMMNEKELFKLKSDWDLKYVLKILFFGNLFIVGLAEISYQIRSENFAYSMVTMLLYSLYFIFAIQLLCKFLLVKSEEKSLIYITFVLSLLIVSVPDFGSVLFNKNLNYGYYLLYLLPLLFAFFQFVRKQFYTQKIDFRFPAFVLVYVICFEIFHLYLWKKFVEI